MDQQIVLSAYDTTDAYAIDLGEIEGDVQKVKVNGEEVEFTTESGLQIPKAQIEKSGYYTLTVMTNKYAYTCQMVVADKVISTAAELTNWAYYVRPADWSINKTNKYSGLVVLGADIDLGGAKYMNELMLYSDLRNKGTTGLDGSNNVSTALTTGDANAFGSSYDSRFYGTFDGLGHTISNFEVAHQRAGLFGSELNGTVKNLAVTGIVIHATNFAGAISGRVGNGAVLENLFLEGKFSQNVNASVALISGNVTGANTKISNVVCVLSHSRTPYADTEIYAAVAGVAADVKEENVSNVIAIASEAPAIIRYGSTPYPILVDSYASVAEYNAANVDVSWLNEYWTTEYGFPIFKSAVDKIPDAVFQVKDASDTEVKEVFVGSSVTISTAPYVQYATLPTASVEMGYYTISVSSEAETEESKLSYDAATGVLTIPENFSVEATIVITATSLLDGTTITLELTTSVPTQEVDE